MVVVEGEREAEEDEVLGAALDDDDEEEEATAAAALALLAGSGSPSCPLVSSPQVKRKPLAVRAAECAAPAARATTGRAQSPGTSVGARRAVEEEELELEEVEEATPLSPSPSCPRPFAPHAYTCDVAVTHSVWRAPQTTWTTCAP